ncbi:MAG: hypothetical protein H8E72_00960 [Candidatus Marinimicrobia bacterium]|nr:hypothetical protein [Candidatus Neomarinimicrobiota bacterium]
MPHFILKIALFTSLIFSSTDYYFYNPHIKSGSEPYFHPINTILNGSFDILRNGTIKSNDITDIAYKNSAKNIWFNITHPIENVKKFGVDEFVELEIFNLSFDPSKGHFLPNIANHVLGNGMLYVKMEEWFDHHNFQHPRLMSFGTTTFYQVMNEVIEHPSGKQYVNVDSISDLLIFNPLGFLLFSFDNVKYFFSNTLPIQDWSLQPMFNPFSHKLENTGQNYIMHLPFLGGKKLQPFVYWGIHGLAGYSYKMENENMVSVGFGRVVNRIRSEIRETDYLENTIFFTPDMDGSASIFLSKNNSLLMSAMVTGPRFYNAQINIYPGVFKLGNFSPGFYCAVGESEGLVFGLSFNEIPFGFGEKFK